MRVNTDLRASKVDMSLESTCSARLGYRKRAISERTGDIYRNEKPKRYPSPRINNSTSSRANSEGYSPFERYIVRSLSGP